MRTAISNGYENEKPGWTRLGFSVLMDDPKVQKILHAVDTLARPPQAACHYNVNLTTALFSHKAV